MPFKRASARSAGDECLQVRRNHVVGDIVEVMKNQGPGAERYRPFPGRRTFPGLDGAPPFMSGDGQTWIPLNLDVTIGRFEFEIFCGASWCPGAHGRAEGEIVVVEGVWI